MSASLSATPAPATIAEAASTNRELSVLARVVKAADLVETLASPGPFTMFAPTDSAFRKLPAGEVERLLQPENRVRLTSFVATHILAGRLTSADLRERVGANHGHLTLRTVDNDTIAVEQSDDGLQVFGVRGATARVTGCGLLQSNGVIHVTDAVLSLPPG